MADELRGIRDALPDRGSFRDFLREVAHVIDDLCPEIHSSYRAEAPEEDEEDEEARRSTSDLSDLNLGGGEGGDDDLLFGGVAGPLRDPSTCEGLTAHKPKEPPSDGLQATVADGTAQAHTNTAEGPALRRGKDDAPTMEAPAVETARGKEAGEVDAGDDVSPVPEASPKPIDPVATVQQTAIKRKRGGGAGKRRRRRRRRLGGPGGDGEPGKGLGRVPPPTAAVVVALCGGALLLAGILAFVMSA